MLVFASVCWFKTARLLVKILIRTLRLCRNGGLAQITQMLTNIHIMAEIFSFSQLSKQRELTFLKVVIDTVSSLPSNIFFWVSEEKKELSPSQILYRKFENFLSLSIYKNIYFIHIKFWFFIRRKMQYYLRGRANTLSENDN